MTSSSDWRVNMKEMLDANPKENDSLDLGDSWKGMPRRTEVLANRSNHHLYRRLKDPDMLSTENAYNVIMVKASTRQNAEGLKKPKTTVSTIENNCVGSVPTSSTPDNIATEETSPKTFEETPALSFTDFIRSNNKTNIRITSTPYVAPHKAGVNQLPKNDNILLPEVQCSPKISLQRTSFLHRNNDSYTTPRSSRGSMNLINNSQLVSQSLRDAEREPHVDIIHKKNKSSNGAQTGSAIVSSTVNSRENLLTSDEDSEEQPVFLKPPEKIQFPKPQIVSSLNSIANKMRSQIHALQNEGQLSTDQPSNSIQNAKRQQESHREVGVSTKEYLELMNVRASNTQHSENSTASSIRRKLYKKGDSIHEDEGFHSNSVASQKVSEDIFDQLRSEQPVTSPVKGILPLSTRKEKTVPVQSFKEKVNSLDDPVDKETNHFQSEVIIQPNKERIDTRAPNKIERRRLRSTHSKSPTNRDQNGSETKGIIQPNKVVNEKQLSKKPKKRAPFSKQSQVHSEPISSELVVVKPLSTEITEKQKQLTKKSQKLPSQHAPMDNEQEDFQPIDIDNIDEVGVAQLLNENEKSPVPSNLLAENEEDNFETSDIQQSNEVDTEKNKSQKRPVLSKPVMHTEQNASETKGVDRRVKGVGKKQLSNKSKKNSQFSKQSQMQSEQNSTKLNFVNQLSTKIGEQKLSKKSQKRPSAPADTEQIVVEPTPIENEPDVEQLSNKSRKRPSPTDDMSEESQQDNFETSDIQRSNHLTDDMSEESQQDDFETSNIQPSNHKVVEKKGQSSKNQQNAMKQPLHVDGPQPKKTRRAARSNKTRTDPEEGESANDINQETNEVDEDQVPKLKRKYKSKTKPTLTNKSNYEALKEREIATGIRHSTRARRLPDKPPTIAALLEKMRLKKKGPVSSSRKKNKAPSTSQALKKKRNFLEDIEEIDECQDEVIIPPDEESNQEDVPPRKKKRPNETEHSTANCVCSNIFNDKLEPLQSFDFHGVRIGTGSKSVTSENLTAHYLPSFTSGRSFGCMTINPNSTKSSCRTVDEMWMMVMSGSTDLIINGEFHTLENGSVVHMHINTKYKLRNNNDHQALIFFTQDTKKTT